MQLNEGLNSISTVDMNTWFTRISEIKVNGQLKNDKSSCKIPNSKDKGLTFRENSRKLQLMNSIALGHVGDEKPVNAIDNNNTTKWSNFASSWILHRPSK